MANRHRAQRRFGGKAFKAGGTVYEGKGSATAKAVHAKHGFAAGGSIETGRAAGGRTRAKFARGGSPMSAAHGGFGGSGGHAGAPHAGGGSGKRKGGRACKADGGPVAPAFKHGGRRKDEEKEDEGEGDDEEDGRGRHHSRRGLTSIGAALGYGEQPSGLEFNRAEEARGGRAKSPHGSKYGPGSKPNKEEFSRKYYGGADKEGWSDEYGTQLTPYEMRTRDEGKLPEESARGGRAQSGRMHYAGGRGRRKHKASGGGNWIAGAIKHPGALHKEMHVPQGEKIPAGKLAKAAHSDNPKLARRARLAETLKGFHH